MIQGYPPEPLLDRNLDPDAKVRNFIPGLVVLITSDDEVDALMREAQFVSDVRHRRIFAAIIADDTGIAGQNSLKWQEDVELLLHSLKIESIKFGRSHAETSLRDYCREFDIRLLMAWQPKRRLPSWSWLANFHRQIREGSDYPPVIFVKRPAETSAGHFAHALEWYLMFGTLIVAAALSLSLRAESQKAIQILLHVLAVTWIAPRVSRVVGVTASVLAALDYNLLNLHPWGSLEIDQPVFWLNLTVITAVTLLFSTLSWQLQSALQEAQLSARKKSSLLQMTRDLLRNHDKHIMFGVLRQNMRDFVQAEVIFLLRDAGGELETIDPIGMDWSKSTEDLKARDHCLASGQECGVGTRLFPLARGFYLPLPVNAVEKGCLAIFPIGREGRFSSDHMRTLDTFASIVNTWLERLAMERLQTTTDRAIRDAHLQNTLFSSISHDLRTPLTAITGYAARLAEGDSFDPTELEQVYRIIYSESDRMRNMLNNLLAMTRLESQTSRFNCETMFVEEIVGTALANCKVLLNGRKLTTSIPDDIGEIYVDPQLMNQVLLNLLDNAVKHTPEGTDITVVAKNDAANVEISVLDNGPGLPDVSENLLFEKFTRFTPTRQVDGTGLGLAIVKAIVELHGGTVVGRNREAGGAEFCVRLPRSQHDLTL